MVKISVVIPVYNGLSYVKKLFASLVDFFDFSIGEIIVINDRSDEETSLYLEGFCSSNNGFKLYVNENNLGFIKSCNRGLRLAEGEISILLNSDTEIPAGFCNKIINCFNSDNSIGIASPISSNSWQHFIPLPQEMTLEQMNELLRIVHKPTYPVIPSAEGFCFCIRREVIEKQGFLDEIYGMGYHEEVDYAYTAILKGWKNVLIDDLYVYHQRQVSFGSERRQKLIEENNKVFYARWQGFRDSYIKINNLENPIGRIVYEMNVYLNSKNSV